MPGASMMKRANQRAICAVEPWRIDVSEQQTESERVAQRKLADLACGDLGV
jgi:hypothetical protein